MSCMNIHICIHALSPIYIYRDRYKVLTWAHGLNLDYPPRPQVAIPLTSMVQTAPQNRTNSIYSMSKLINGVGQIHVSTLYLYPLISIYWTFICWAYIYINALSFTLTLVDDLFRCFRAWPPWPPLKVLAANPKGVWP